MAEIPLATKKVCLSKYLSLLEIYQFQFFLVAGEYGDEETHVYNLLSSIFNNTRNLLHSLKNLNSFTISTVSGTLSQNSKNQ